MKVTALTGQVRHKERVNVSIDGVYRFSLDMSQVIDFGVRVGREYTEAELDELEEESRYGKLYTRTLEYVLVRPRSIREVQEYLYRKTRSTRTRHPKTGEWQERLGVSVSLTERVLDRLVAKSYVNDETFARYWIENRQERKGISRRKLHSELAAKGIDKQVIEELLGQSLRNDQTEIQKVIAKKRKRYDDPKKLVAYLSRLGFQYDDIQSALRDSDQAEDELSR